MFYYLIRIEGLLNLVKGTEALCFRNKLFSYILIGCRFMYVKKCPVFSKDLTGQYL